MKLFAAELQQREQQVRKQILRLQPHSCGWDGRHQRCEHGWRQYQLQLRTSYRKWSAPYGVLVRVRDWRVLPCPPEGVVVRWKGTCPSGKSWSPDQVRAQNHGSEGSASFEDHEACTLALGVSVVTDDAHVVVGVCAVASLELTDDNV